MSHDAGPSSAHAREVLDVLSRGDVESFVGLVGPEVEIHTARGVRRGRDEAAAWASSSYEHLERRYEIEEMHVAGEDVLVLAKVEYVWRESGDVGDSKAVAVALGFAQGKLRRWEVYDDQALALKVFEQGVELRSDQLRTD